MPISKHMWDTFWDRFYSENPRPTEIADTNLYLKETSLKALSLFDLMIEEFESEGLINTAETFKKMRKLCNDTWSTW